jgi:hypothetical protein
LAIDRVDQWVASFGRALQGLDDHLLDLFVGHRPRAPRAGLVDEPVETLLGEALAPLGHHRPVHAQALGDLDVRQALGGQQHDP